jgi:predicted nucleic acid-binding protein
MAKIVIDTSAVVSAVLDEPEKAELIELTRGVDLLAPGSQRWELGNAFSSLFKKKRLALSDALMAIQVYQTIPIQFVEVELGRALEIADALGIYAYDAYMIACALDHKAPLLTLDRALKRQAERLKVMVLEI